VQPAPAAPVPPFGVAVAAGLVAGIAACLALPALLPWPWSLSLAAAGLWSWWRPGLRRAAGAALVGFGLCGLHAAASLAGQLPMAHERGDFPVEGRVVELPVHEARRTRFAFRVDDDAGPPFLRGALLRLAWYDDGKPPGRHTRVDIAPGSRWRFDVRLRAPRGLRNPGPLDSEKHAFARRVAATGYVRTPARAERLARATGIDAWRDRMSGRIGAAVRSNSSRFVRALALGDTRGLDDRDWEALRATGLTHLIAISGFHVGLVAGFFALLAAGIWRAVPPLGLWLPRPQAAAIAALAGAAGYAAVAGFALPTVRTTVMIAVVVAARLWRRPMRVGDALALAAIVVLLPDPLAVLGAGFWLSFAGVAWLAWCLPKAHGRHLLREFLSAQGVATVGLLPLTVVLFGQASLAGPLANLVAIPWWSLVVVPLSLVGTALEALHAGAGGGAWRAAAWCFDLSWPLFERLASSQFSLWWLPEARWFALPMALSAAAWCLLPRGVPGKPLAVLLWLPLLWSDRDLPPPGGFDVTVLDVGQGLSVLVRTHRSALLYDMGPAITDGYDAGERAVVPALHAIGVRRLDVAVVSHADGDHAGGLDAVARRFPPRRLLAPAGSGIPDAAPCRAGTRWRRDGVLFEFLHPDRHFPYLRNEASCVLRIASRHGTALLTGDIGAVIERTLVAQQAAALPADVVVIAHHGSAHSSDPAFTVATSPRLALVSAGHGNRFNHPDPGVVARWTHAGATVLTTPDAGALRISVGPDGITPRTERHANPTPWDAARRAARETR
jgi:competence protein ComEC